VTERIASQEENRNHANEMKGLDAACKEEFGGPEKISIKKIEDGSVLSIDTTP